MSHCLFNLCEDCACLPSYFSHVRLFVTLDCSLPGSSVCVILQARILEWVAGLPSGDLPNPGIKPMSPVAPALKVDSFPAEPPRKPYMQITSCNARLDLSQARIKIGGRNISNLRYADDTTLVAESGEEVKRLLMRVKEENEKKLA